MILILMSHYGEDGLNKQQSSIYWSWLALIVSVIAVAFNLYLVLR